MTCFDCLHCKECAKQEKIMLIVDGIGEYVYQCNVEKDCPNFLDGDAALDLINRLQAEVERLTEENEEVHSNWQKLKKSYDELSDEAKTEIKRKDKILNSYAFQYGTVKDQSKRIEEIKSAARKEFAERVHGIISPEYGGYHRAIYNLLKELDGKENENA